MPKNKFSDDDLKEKSKKIEAIYNEAVSEIKELEKKQREIIDNCIIKLEQIKIEKIRNVIKEK
ncbi:MAG: hypothetical protein A2271_01525 [Candidatus Moranbacteria bacterium RIFOXYA12_FULL_35_19]|nr:MAG: hypothetical protein UR78_C0012G0024 [Candidatus Moranbacteria bacterium GW2011_GWF2_35_39]OGI32914.1 MAG: hypothetical protein A2489_00655 [Candidatus Moranbacteria bacterium RIFOXYC12_FULL_36_13]OGI35966.1 MAG: hypothetical protein A2271_01525 [Candidatus Moranbacteria bacterium RIFOXYA12_FULL_35_19]